MSMSTSYTADGTFSTNYYPSDNSSSYVDIEGTTFRLAQQRTPSSSSDTGISGEICHDSNYIYICTSVNTWKRIALSTF